MFSGYEVCFKKEDIPELIKGIVLSRNYLTHYSKSQGEKFNRDYAFKLHSVNDILEGIISLNILELILMDKEAAIRCYNKANRFFNSIYNASKILGIAGFFQNY